MSPWEDKRTIDALLGKIIVDIDGKVGDETLRFKCSDGSEYQMHYYDDCCASSNVEDIAGDLDDLIGSPIVRAEEPSSLDGFDGKPPGDYTPESYTWTFYILGTAKGTVTIRWYGSSNGYYSETPTFEQTASGSAGEGTEGAEVGKAQNPNQGPR